MTGTLSQEIPTASSLMDISQDITFDGYIQYHQQIILDHPAELESSESSRMISPYPPVVNELHSEYSESPTEIDSIPSESAPMPESIHTSPQIREAIYALCVYANWTYPKLHEVFGVSLELLYCIHRSTHQKGTLSSRGDRGRLQIANSGITQHLIETATASSYQRRLPYTRIAELVCSRALY
ncbi:hypothetical protein B9Z19DRAFT_1131680 [Tuber borchii]|uniref:Uncharacterized protein n=1 Tax=Tuber borchii TaxID=42251 RepID=A0A2T6ZIA5_TUBBO|nr:hypothetical protein B9Z19DRAFT_1131680 [Tuber borchii]